MASSNKNVAAIMYFLVKRKENKLTFDKSSRFSSKGAASFSRSFLLNVDDFVELDDDDIDKKLEIFESRLPNVFL